ncbi:MAG: hypothetical protein HZA49_06875 [Planctomycetes bacterium]|nr:hypothetical protein [Planctomycetota bacterium]
MIEENNQQKEVMEQAMANVLRRDRQLKNTWTIFIGGLLGCGAPIVAIYGLIFLLINREPFPRKTLAIIGTVIAWIWTLLLIVYILIIALTK